jgi:hypothetical protein
MDISADFEKPKQYFDKKNIALLHYCFIAISLYRNIACQNCLSDESLRVGNQLFCPLVEKIVHRNVTNEEAECKSLISKCTRCNLELVMG